LSLRRINGYAPDTPELSKKTKEQSKKTKEQSKKTKERVSLSIFYLLSCFLIFPLTFVLSTLDF